MTHAAPSFAASAPMGESPSGCVGGLYTGRGVYGALKQRLAALAPGEAIDAATAAAACSIVSMGRALGLRMSRARIVVDGRLVWRVTFRDPRRYVTYGRTKAAAAALPAAGIVVANERHADAIRSCARRFGARVHVARIGAGPARRVTPAPCSVLPAPCSSAS